jgi:hypothetical protein
MMELALLGIAAIFAYFAVNFKNEGWRNFFVLMSMLFTLLTLTVPKIETNYWECLNFNQNGTCISSKSYVTIAGNDALIFGFGMLLIAMFVIVMVSIFVKTTKIVA